MKHSKKFSITVAFCLLLYGVLGFLGLPHTTFHGDLTRIAILPEHIFGWIKTQPVIPQKLMAQSPMNEADVFVLGDSFSDPRVWQTILTKQGLKVRTEIWNNLPAICADFSPWLRDQGFTGKYVIFETVERDLVENVAKSSKCNTTLYKPGLSTDTLRAAPPASFDISRSDYLGKLSTGVKVLSHLLWNFHMQNNTDFKSWKINSLVQMTRLQNGCELFSHVQCSDSLFLTRDDAADLEVKLIHDIELVNSRIIEFKPIWAIVPNRSTAYLYPNKYFWDRAEKQFGSSNLLRMTQIAIAAKTVDLYPANNSHFSTEGYLLMGAEIFSSIRNINSVSAQ